MCERFRQVEDLAASARAAANTLRGPEVPGMAALASTVNRHSSEEFSDAPNGTAGSFAFQLLILEESREDLLTDDEYQEQRRSVLSDLCGRDASLRSLLPVLGTCTLGAALVSAYGFLAEDTNFVYGGLFAFAVSLITVVGLYRSDRAASALGKQDRLRIVDQLQSWDILSASEADHLKASIEKRQSEP
ncbi:MAG: hypothetical protein GY719_12290 [bacterium]|nr:hypothetical protein [bacterium]